MNNTDLEKEYELLAPLYEQFGRELTHQLEELLSQQNVSLGFPLQYRVKSLNSTLQKIGRPSLNIKSIKELSDLIGLRVILLFKRDVESVCALIRKNFKVYSEEDAQVRLSEGEFGYSSVHFLVGLSPAWKKLPTFQKCRELRAEIQVRSVAQHIWAAASHVLQYKQEQGVPPPVRRAIYRVSALLETVDLEFERVLAARSSYQDAAQTESGSEKLNVDLLVKILDETLPGENKTDDEDYAGLLNELIALSVSTPKDLMALLNKHRFAIGKLEAEMVERFRGTQMPQPELTERLWRGVYYAHCGLVRNVLRLEFGKQFEALRNKLLQSKQRKVD